MAIDHARYLSYAEAVLIHFTLMEYYGETRYGIFSRELIESALARAPHAATYENADLIRQAAHLCFGFIQNHPWIGGNKRTATMLMREFLRLNSLRFRAPAAATVEMVLAVEADRWQVTDIETWLRDHVQPLT